MAPHEESPPTDRREGRWVRNLALALGGVGVLLWIVAAGAEEGTGEDSPWNRWLGVVGFLAAVVAIVCVWVIARSIQERRSRSLTIPAGSVGLIASAAASIRALFLLLS